MRTAILTCAFGLLCFSALPQGTLNFANGAAGVDAPVWIGGVGTGTRLSGTNWIAQLWYGPAGTPEYQLTPHPHTATFSTIPVYAGYFFGGVRTLDGLPGGSVATVQIRVSYAPFLDWGWVGASNPINVTLRPPPEQPPNLVGLQPFSIIPEPSFALVALGAATLMIFRSRK